MVDAYLSLLQTKFAPSAFGPVPPTATETTCRPSLYLVDLAPYRLRNETMTSALMELLEMVYDLGFAGPPPHGVFIVLMDRTNVVSAREAYSSIELLSRSEASKMKSILQNAVVTTLLVLPALAEEGRGDNGGTYIFRQGSYIDPFAGEEKNGEDASDIRLPVARDWSSLVSTVFGRSRPASSASHDTSVVVAPHHILFSVNALSVGDTADLLSAFALLGERQRLDPSLRFWVLGNEAVLQTRLFIDIDRLVHEVDSERVYKRLTKSDDAAFWRQRFPHAAPLWVLVGELLVALANYPVVTVDHVLSAVVSATARTVPPEPRTRDVSPPPPPPPRPPETNPFLAWTEDDQSVTVDVDAVRTIAVRAYLNAILDKQVATTRQRIPKELLRAASKSALKYSLLLSSNDPEQCLSTSLTPSPVRTHSGEGATPSPLRNSGALVVNGHPPYRSFEVLAQRIVNNLQARARGLSARGPPVPPNPVASVTGPALVEGLASSEEEELRQLFDQQMALHMTEL